MSPLDRIEHLIRLAPDGETCAEEIADAVAPLLPLLREWAERTAEYRDIYPLDNDEQFKAWLRAERALLASLRGEP